MVPGYQRMLDLSLMEKMQARPPPPEDLVKAWRRFFQYKCKKDESVNSLQAQHCLRLSKHLRALNSDEENCGLGYDDYKIALGALRRLPKDHQGVNVELARHLHMACLENPTSTENQHSDLTAFVHILTKTGNSYEARDLVAEACSNHSSSPDLGHHGKILNRWLMVHAGFAQEKNEIELLKSFQTAEQQGLVYSPNAQMILTTFYAARDDVEATRRWYNRPLEDDPDSGVKRSGRPAAPTIQAILRLCARKNELDWCKEVFVDLLEKSPTKRLWDVILQWAAGVMGKGVEDVERMIEVMIRRNADNPSMRPDTETINGLVELAMSKNDSYLAERYLAVGSKFGIRPNAKTYILQMDYRARVNDLSGAQAAYDALQSEEVSRDEDLPAINLLIRALCTAKEDNYNRIVSILTDLEERKKRLEADTVAHLTRMYLQRDQTDDMIDMLQTETYHYALDERSRIIQTFISFCIDKDINNVRSWEAYTIMRQVFDETPTKLRTQMMNEYFSRGRCDMACHVFGHMRQHAILNRRPKLETYVQCFEGIARCEDRESLDMVHNMLKMDSSIEPNTKLYNSLMLAYTACDEASIALDLWDDITNTSEGPSYTSLEIVFWACGRKPFGDRKARDIWNKMRRMEIEVTGNVFASYVGALAGQGKFEEARDMVEGMERDLGLKLDVQTYVATLFACR